LTGTPQIRSAIYTRKSTDEGLDQNFNSLDAQYEACAAYIASQKQEGWVLARSRFDDGGVSGGTLERPALQRLLAEIDAGRIGMVVVYKIDRLTRSLADFAKLVERLDAAGCSFVSVTQAFNTASSMGRLTLNVLLSFAQFEREVTAERIRDKIAASKKLGMWMGGVPPLGYDPHPDPNVRELVVNACEADTVRTLFALYDAHGKVNAVSIHAASMGLRSKRHAFRSGRIQGGNGFSNGQIHKLLTNPVYLGQIRHKDLVWPGRHPAIIDTEIWDRVQAKLQRASRRRRGQRTDTNPAPLIGKLRDETGDRLTPTHTTKAGRRHHYYVSNRLITGGPDPTGWRMPAHKFEQSTAIAIADHLHRAASRHELLDAPDLRADPNIQAAAQRLIADLRSNDPNVLRDMIVRGKLESRKLQITLDRLALAKTLEVAPDSLAPGLEQVTIEGPFRRRGSEAKTAVGVHLARPDHVLLSTLLNAHRWSLELRAGTPLREIASEAGHHNVHIRTRAALAFLSPKIQGAIRDGALPSDLNLQRILDRGVPLDWAQQERLFGMA